VLNKNSVSIIIPTYNSEKTLSICLKSVKSQTYKNIEAIVVDNFSKDRTIEIAKRANAKVCLVRAERGRAKNLGMKKAMGDFICFIDSDMELTPNVIKECSDLAKLNEKIGGIIIPEESVGNSFWVKVRDFERSFYYDTSIESARFFRKNLAKSVNGFDEDVVFFEESTLPQKIEEMGYNVRARIKSEILHHEEDFYIWKWLKKKYYYGKTGWKYKERYKEHSGKQTSLYWRLCLFLKNRRFYSRPLLALGVLVLKCLEYFSAGLGFLVAGEKDVA
jgi:glycosyltransferase involved in cell wall biosynthesis